MSTTATAAGLMGRHARGSRALRAGPAARALALPGDRPDAALPWLGGQDGCGSHPPALEGTDKLGSSQGLEACRGDGAPARPPQSCVVNGG